ncbi:MAG: tetratricopeptide repeat protein [Gemmataceae bacterium]|nr:tetratricopeptide repeat protein [Gemmataceae bacterium]
MTPDAERLNLLIGLRRYAEAEAVAREAIGRDPHWGGGYTHLARALINRNRAEEAIAAAREGVRLAPKDAWAAGTLACALNWFNRTRDALDPARQAVRLDPTYAWAYAMLANILYGLGRFEEARQAAADGLARDPAVESLYRWKGWAEHALGRYDEARRTAADGARRHPNSHLLLNLLGRVEWSRAEQARGRRRLALHRAADAALSAAARLDPSQPAYRTNRRENATAARRHVVRAVLTAAAVVNLVPAAVFAVVAQPTGSDRFYLLPLAAAVAGVLIAPFIEASPGTMFALPLGRLPTAPPEPGDRWTAIVELAGYVLLLFAPPVLMAVLVIGNAVRL